MFKSAYPHRFLYTWSSWDKGTLSGEVCLCFAAAFRASYQWLSNHAACQETLHKIIKDKHDAAIGYRGIFHWLSEHAYIAGRGYGRLLMERAEAFLSQTGCPEVNICVRRNNGAVLAFYNSLAYEQDDVVVLGRKLIPDD